MNTKAAILLVALMALMSSSQAISSDEKQKITKDTAPLTIATKSVFVDVGNRKIAMMVLREPAGNCVAIDDPCGLDNYCCEGLICDNPCNGRCYPFIPPKSCITEGNPCGLNDWFNGRCNCGSGLPTTLSSIV